MSQSVPKTTQKILSVRVEDEPESLEKHSVPFSAHTSSLLSPASAVSSRPSSGAASEGKNGTPVSPSDASSRPSLDDDTDSDDSSSYEEEDDEPSLQMMGEDHVRKQKAKGSQGHLGLAIPSSLPRSRVISDSRAYDPNSSASDLVPSQSSPPPSNSAAGEVALSPAMMFLAGMNSPFSAARRTTTSPAPSKPSEERIGTYVLGEVIGHGGFSVIRKGTSPSGVVAVKIVSKSSSSSSHRRPPSADASLENEIAVWSSLHHEYILPLFNSYRTDDGIYLVSLYCPAGSLFNILRLHGSPGLPHDDVGTMFRQIIRGLRYLHEQARIVHGDIKLENILVDEMGACRIADFGLASRISEETMRSQEDESSTPHSALPPHLRGRSTRHRNSTHVPGNSTPSSLHHFPPGSLPYASPELLLPPSRTPTASQDTLPRPYPANPAQDIWAVGCLLHALLTGRLPFVDTYEPRLQMKIVRGVWERSRSKTRSRVRGSSSRSRSRMRSSSRDHRRFQHQVGSRDISRSRSRDVKIGKGARTVLRGCICVEVNKRWTAAQIDEVAWNVGWEDPQTIVETEIVAEDSTENNDTTVTAVMNTLSDAGLKAPDHLEAGWLTDEGGDKLTPMSSRLQTTSRDGSRVKNTGRRSETLP
ncbi:hypothetical protein FS842_010214 [Serendipita sp. 407]|nr:hypothetical protein FS842_010214 [Serendipita sp. 407]